LLVGLSVEEAQKLVIGVYQNSRIISILEKLNPKPLDENLNAFCLIAGNTDRTYIEGHVARILMYMTQLGFIKGEMNFFFSGLVLLSYPSQTPCDMA